MFASIYLLLIVFANLSKASQPENELSVELEDASKKVNLKVETLVKDKDSAQSDKDVVQNKDTTNVNADEVCYKATIFPENLHFKRDHRVRFNSPICKPVCVPRFNHHKKPICNPVCEPKFKHHKRPICKPVCEPRFKHHKRTDWRPRKNFCREEKIKIWEPKCKPVCEPKVKHHREHKFVKWEPECKPVCEPKIKHHRKVKFEPKCKPVCEPKVIYERESESDSWEPECKPVCEPRFKHHRDVESEDSDRRYEYSSDYEYEVDCREGFKYDNVAPFEPEEELFRTMIHNDHPRRRQEPVCRPVCEPRRRPRPIVDCKPRCEPLCRPRPFEDCRPVFEPTCRPRQKWVDNCKPRPFDECKPFCEPFCRPECDPILKKHKKRRRRREFRRDIVLIIRLIRQVLLQGGFEVNRLSRCFSEEIKTKLLEGLHLIIKSTSNKVAADLRKLEQRIADIVIATTKNVLRETDALITNTNENILDNLRSNIRVGNRTILSDIAALVAAATDPDTAAVQPLDQILNILNTNFANMMVDVPTAFKKSVQEEKTAVEKIVNDNKNDAIREVAKLIEEFEQKLGRQLVSLTEEEMVFIRNIVDQAARKLLVDLQHILQQIGEGIIIIIKGRNCEFRPLLFGIEPELGWNALDDELLL